MAEKRVQRRLAAILAADVVGYSRLMHADETGTLAQLRTLRKELFEPKTSEHQGRIVKTSGDGALVEFASAVDAVQCSIEIQRALAKRNDDVPPDRRIELRIGINVGDVVIDDGDVYGDGVNVAARLEALAEPGGIWISGDVYRQVRGKVEADFKDLGEQKVKNIDEPLRVYTLLSGQSRPEAERSAQVNPIGQLPSVAVLPFDNLSGDPDQEYFSDGIAEDIISALSRSRFLFVAARNSSFSYKGKSPNVRQVATELGARYVLEGSVRKAGSRVRIAVQLIEGETGNHLWAERFDSELDNIFDVQDDITQRVVGALQPELGKAEQERAKAKRTENLAAWDAYQRGMWHFYRRTKLDFASAIQFFQRSIELESDFAPPYWGAAICHSYTVLWGWADSRDVLLETALRFARRGVELDPENTMSHTAMGYARWIRREHGDAVAALQTAIELDPNNYLAPRLLGLELIHTGNAAQALPHLHNALRLSPRDPLANGTMSWLGVAYFFKGEKEVGAEWARRGMRHRQGPQVWLVTNLLSILGHLGKEDEAKRTLAELLRVQPDITRAFVREYVPITDPDYLDQYIDGLRKAGLPE